MANTELNAIEEKLAQLEYRKSFGEATIKLNLALALAEARQAQQLRQEDLATLLGVSQAYIAKLESGGANPTIGRIGSLLAAIWLQSKFAIEPLTQQVQAVRSRESSTMQRETSSAYEDAVLNNLDASRLAGTTSGGIDFGF